MNSDNISSRFLDASKIGITTKSRSDLELSIIATKHELAVADVRDLMAEYINKGDNIYSQNSDEDLDLDKMVKFVETELFDAEFFEDTTRSTLANANLDTSDQYVAATYDAAVKSVAEQYYSILSESNNMVAQPEEFKIENSESMIIA